MAYVRWSGLNAPHPYDSQIYVMNHVDGDLACVGCHLNDLEDHREPTAEAMANHVAQHAKAGHAVPDFVIPTLLGVQPRWHDSTIEEMLTTLKNSTEGGTIVSTDADVPAEYRTDFAGFLASWNPSSVVKTDLYFCPMSGQIEDPLRGGFDVCCDHPELHRDITTAEWGQAITDAINRRPECP